ncbi:MAG: patatin family protein [Lactobacillus sp.]|uniref:patatin-like phospholipase family protein n=1 Tax=Lactobacillus sp. TaxID=1591 RepID=UPI00264A18D4|nr:patatin family protein [Lactobacillus sp.]MDN5956007.1 patatin family protein [Lactobacillus sp.]MDN5988620.1 patatin family protein [Lactobacillus sp.]MDN6008913.1 patatin family protein [Lactobacillus sp.]MDN6023421.1 patatin family protein [Lactobacillus sp.]MDN6590612.1 patatin family protein [Lactobacillus sp.]
MKSGLVLEGGAMRGLFTAGVLDVLMENNISFDSAIGVSAGAAFGVNMKSEQIGRVLRYNLRFTGKPYYASWKSWRRSGNLYAANFCYHVLPDKLDVFDKKTFMANPMDFWCMATDAATGEPVYHKLRDAGYVDLEWIRASSSIPFFAHPVAIGGHYYFDGGVSDAIPYGFLKKNNFDKKIVITTQPKEYRKKQSKLFPVEKVLLREYPAVLDKLATRAEDYNAVLDNIEADENAGETFVIRPPEALNIGTLEQDKNEIKRVYQVGRQEAEKILPGLVSYLNE